MNEYITNLEAISANIDSTIAAANRLWILISAVMIFFMQAGFALLEAGTVRKKNSLSILSKNMLDGCVSAIAFFLTGYALAYGDVDGGFAGSKYFAGFALREDKQIGKWIFNYSFSSTCTTLVSGATAERVKVGHYLIFSVLMSGLICPLVIGWTWGGGWLHEMGYHDFAGGMIIHGTAGWAGLVATKIIGPRDGIFQATQVSAPVSRRDTVVMDTDPASRRRADLSQVRQLIMSDIESNNKPHNITFVVVGTSILWMCWLFFNGGSSLSIHADGGVTSELAIANTILAGAAGGLFSFYAKGYLVKIRADGQFKVTAACNGILAGLVSVTSCCDIIDFWAAIVVGTIGTAIYCMACYYAKKWRIDDPLEVFMIHGVAGTWGVVAVAFFDEEKGILYGGSMAYLGKQLFGTIVIAIFAMAASFLFFKVTFRGCFKPSSEEMHCGSDLIRYLQREGSGSGSSSTASYKFTSIRPFTQNFELHK
mmetsp:Transcript_40353/g.46234  ORF Transcript_40353/g.46234 Transcript_40353/m.46234 type:complete len:481 (-) Transcript_40353:69-1511(-)